MLAATYQHIADNCRQLRRDLNRMVNEDAGLGDQERGQFLATLVYLAHIKRVAYARRDALFPAAADDNIAWGGQK